MTLVSLSMALWEPDRDTGAVAELADMDLCGNVWIRDLDFDEFGPVWVHELPSEAEVAADNAWFESILRDLLGGKAD